jgi:NADP-dependent 3-hydroxy acid dehydrogenase YdfG
MSEQTETNVILITGASAGIGAALARQLAPKGHKLVLVARRADRLAEVAADCGENALAVVADVTDQAQLDAAIAAAIARFGHLDVWVSNAGQGITRQPSQITDSDLDAMVNINVKAVWNGVRAALPHFAERGTGQFIHVSSMLGRVPFAPIRSAYVGAKHMMNALTASLRIELAQTHPGVVVSLVSPGVVFTEFGSSALHGGPDSRAFPDGQTAEEVAAVIEQAILTRATDLYTRAGAQARVAGYYANLGSDPA